MTMTMPEVDGSEATTRYLNAEFTQSVKDEVLLPDEAGSIAEQYLMLDDTIKDLSKQKDHLANQLKMMMQEHEAGVAGAHRITWKAATRTNLDSAKLKAALGDKYDEYTKKTSYRTLQVA